MLLAFCTEHPGTSIEHLSHCLCFSWLTALLECQPVVTSLLTVLFTERGRFVLDRFSVSLISFLCKLQSSWRLAEVKTQEGDWGFLQNRLQRARSLPPPRPASRALCQAKRAPRAAFPSASSREPLIPKAVTDNPSLGPHRLWAHTSFMQRREDMTQWKERFQVRKPRV